ncbi:hypothetical protein AWC12_18865 [Mycolicibacterium iranicum]|uniref:Uncharacterized protein n=1 Tax=Mycolicibacterium iranicum TaxID=912594 RepID=A0A1X1WIN5_MYCIR|nr:hypothetical protein AWC12_18865 [Mycolicibacterium iranicum]
MPAPLLLAGLLALLLAAGGFGAGRGGPLVTLLHGRLLLFRCPLGLRSTAWQARTNRTGR